MIKTWKIFPGDVVEVMSGKSKGKQGHVEEVLKEKNAVILEGINLHERKIPSTPMAAGRLFLAPGPIHYSNVALVDPTTQKGCRIKFKYLEDGTRVRVSKASGEIIPYPDRLKEVKTPKPTGPMDTPPDVVLKRTASADELIQPKDLAL